MAAELVREQAFAGGDRLFLGHLAEAELRPGGLGAFDDEGRGRGVELVGVRPDPAVLGLLEDEGEGVVEFLRGAEPDELAAAGVDVGPEVLGVGGAGARVQPVARHHEVVVAGQRLDVVHLGLEAQVDAELAGTVLEQHQELLAADAAEAVAAGDGAGALELHRDVVPVGEVLADRRGADRVVGSEVAERLVRQHHAPAEGVVGLVALEHHHLVGGVAQLHGDGEIEAGRATPEACDAHLQSPPCRHPTMRDHSDSFD